MDSLDICGVIDSAPSKECALDLESETFAEIEQKFCTSQVENCMHATLAMQTENCVDTDRMLQDSVFTGDHTCQCILGVQNVNCKVTIPHNILSEKWG